MTESQIPAIETIKWDKSQQSQQQQYLVEMIEIHRSQFLQIRHKAEAGNHLNGSPSLTIYFNPPFYLPRPATFARLTKKHLKVCPVNFESVPEGEKYVHTHDKLGHVAV